MGLLTFPHAGGGELLSAVVHVVMKCISNNLSHFSVVAAKTRETILHAE